MNKDPFKLKSVPWHKRSRQERQVSLFYPNSLSPEDRKAVEACRDYHAPPKLLDHNSRQGMSPLGGAMKVSTPKGKR